MQINLCIHARIILSVLLLVYLKQGAALRCYDCFSLNNLYCNDPFIKNSTSSKVYPQGSVCVKIKGDLKNGDGFIVKREGMLEKDFDELTRSKTFSDANLEKCNSDLCNSSNVITFSWASVVSSAALSIASLFFSYL